MEKRIVNHKRGDSVISEESKERADNKPISLKEKRDIRSNLQSKTQSETKSKNDDELLSGVARPSPSLADPISDDKPKAPNDTPFLTHYKKPSLTNTDSNRNIQLLKFCDNQQEDTAGKPKTSE
uniref:Uncharacterized protein n=1 Tax=Euplotes harpa TaxID=151035 RepID=A0A7S3JNK9_9SPIT|mmetsp:Transcript_7232/g.8219  ORF Transcript_7232/g.8219 Transcript_7232/m.8219 type:complete len:124 (+) Transcript_7232:357-728(+)